MSSFVRYILKHKDQQTAYGDLAREICADPDINRNWSYGSFSRYLANKGACQRVFELVDALAWEYQEMKGLKYYWK